MIWPWQKHLRSTDTVIPCKCGSTLPAAVALRLHNAVLRQGRLLLVETGYRLSCQECGASFSVGPNGRFQHDARALPFTPSPATDEDHRMRRPAQLVPKERP